jgi:hypothetical protein
MSDKRMTAQHSFVQHAFVPSGDSFILRRDGEMERWRDGEMERWRDGEMERWRDGEMERWRDGEMERWRVEGSAPGCNCADRVFVYWQVTIVEVGVVSSRIRLKNIEARRNARS